MARRLSAAEKGKGTVVGDYEPPRTARVRIQAPDNSLLLQKHSLTLIGRVTNPSMQKVWNLIPFFTEHWRTEKPPIGADLGQGVFKFQFESEPDLLAVLEKRPYHFSRWMIILQRWEPTLSQSFPSLIPFWIKVQGIPVHLWTEETMRTIGEDIGWVEAIDITSSAARMRVHVNGRLPLIMSSVIEYSSGEEVTVNLVYERLERHCSLCFRLDHELRDCLEAKAQKKAREAQNNSLHDSESKTKDFVPKEKAPIRQVNQFKFTATRNQEDSQISNSNQKVTGERRMDMRRERDNNYQTRDRRREEDTRPLRSSYGGKQGDSGTYRRRDDKRSHSFNKHGNYSYKGGSRDHSQGPRSYYREISKPRDSEIREESLSSKNVHNNSGGTPLEKEKEKSQTPIPREVLEAAREELREVMIQYSNVADPTESAARKERYRQAEVLGQFEEAAAQMARASMTAQSMEVPCREVPTQERLPASRRISYPPSFEDSTERVPATLRLSTVPSECPDIERMPVGLRLGPVNEIPIPSTTTCIAKRKPGRPPGKRKIQSSPKSVAGASSRKRKTVQAKAPLCRKKLSTEAGPSTKSTKASTARKSSATDHPVASQESASQLSDNQVLSDFLPKRKKTVDFQNPPNLVP
ncbi:hypothetical protein N665_0511s0019 [Sinapis alba]|nr:hypothetical protein N665_0511s0019 [Sinapis alba]